ncbi:MAG: NAD(P)H-hydrate dehydratase, partial [Eggerthellaceae bacterium]|nr:NAD(P)H-hydrate dehydratase [Eggerthellaceae bacterium]
DVLAGMIGGLLAQGVATFEAAHAGVVLHARAGLAAAEDLTDISVVPEDLIAYLPRVLKSLSA